MKGVIQFISGQKAWHGPGQNTIVMDHYPDSTREKISGTDGGGLVQSLTFPGMFEIALFAQISRGLVPCDPSLATFLIADQKDQNRAKSFFGKRDQTDIRLSEIFMRLTRILNSV